MNKKWGVIGAACIIVIAVSVALSLNSALSGGAGDAVTVSGEGRGFGGPISASVTLSGGRITGLEITGEKETAAIGGTAIMSLTESILAAGSIDGVQAISGATITSNGVFDAIRAAIRTASAPSASAPAALPAQGSALEEIPVSVVTHGVGVTSIGRITPYGTYSFNVVLVSALFDDAGRILDLEADVLAVAVPLSSGAAPRFAGYPGQSYSDRGTMREQTEEAFLAEVLDWRTKRERGNTCMMPSGTWAEEMDIFEEAFKGMTVDELQQWFASYCSDINGKPLSPASELDADIAKYNALSADGRAELNAVSGASMSLNDPHGDIIGAIVKAFDNRRPVNAC